MDTGQALQLRDALTRLEALLTDLGDRLSTLATTHRDTVMAGAPTASRRCRPRSAPRSPWMWLAEATRQLGRLREARTRACAIELFGAGGTSAAMGPDAAAVRHAVASSLGLAPVDDAVAPRGPGRHRGGVLRGGVHHRHLRADRARVADLADRDRRGARARSPTGVARRPRCPRRRTPS
ncbi:MAG: hypothetical protein R3C32_02125 [Chloroflexota bacterium]